jgi:hypothetical protein
MKRLALLVAVVAVFAFIVPVTAASPPQAYLLGSAAPLTQAQVEQLKQAGATITHVYRTFGGVAATIPSNKLRAVRGLPFITSLKNDTPKQLHSLNLRPGAVGALPGTPYWLDLIDAEKNTTSTGSGVWVAVLDSGFYPNWRDYFKESSVLANLASAFIGPNGTSNDNQWDGGASG